MKYLPSILSFFTLALLGTTVAHAQNYTPLAPLPGTVAIDTNGATVTNMSLYISGGIKLLVALGAATAFLFAVIGGTQYVAASINPSAKADAMERIQRSLIGLAIILTSYLILNSINPKLVQFNLMLEPVSVKQLTKAADNSQTWGDDTSDRNALSKASHISVNKDNCTSIGQTDCTSVYEISLSALNGLKALAEGCRTQTGFGVGYCDIVITGGTEYWAHKSHNDGHKVDLRHGGDLDKFITAKGVVNETACGFADDYHYEPLGPTGGVYVDEQNRTNAAGWAPHWHVCY